MVSHLFVTLFQLNGAISPPLLFIFLFVLSFHTWPLLDRYGHVKLYSDYILAQWHHYFVRVPCFFNNTAWHYLAISFLINDAISSLPWFFVVFCHRSMFYLRVLVRPLIMITDFIWCNLLIDLALIFILFITNYQKRTKIWQGINLHWINNIKAWCD